MSVQRKLADLATFSARHAWLVVLGGVLLGALALFGASRGLGITTNTDAMFSASLPWRRQAIAFDKAFPQFHDLLVAVVSGATPEEADATARAIAAAAAADPAHFSSVQRPGALPFFRTEGLLFLSRPQLQSLLNGIIDAQPFLGQLAADPSARGLFSALSLMAMGVAQGQADLAPYAAAMKGFHQALAAAAAGRPVPLSWQRLLAGPLAKQAGKYRFVLIRPVQDYGALQPGGAATAVLRAIAAKVPFVQQGRAQMRITGSIALADEEFATIAKGMAVDTIVSVALIALWLFLAVRSVRLIVPILGTLLLGLALTTGFAAAAVGTLNLVSVAFAVLFVGIAVDFAIQFCVRFRGVHRREGSSTESALAGTMLRAGGAMLLAACAVAAGFFAFVPTSFRGVAELGLIAGVGMLIAFACTAIFLPAALALCRPAEERAYVGFAWAAPADAWVWHRRRRILAAFALVAVAGLVLLPRVRFDSNPLHTKNPNTEAMRTLRDLMNAPQTSPFTIDILAPDAKAAARLAGRLGKLKLVSGVLTADSFVPAHQKQKLALIADAANLLAPTLSPGEPASAVRPGDLRLAITAARAQIAAALPKLPPGSELAAIGQDLKRLAGQPDAVLMEANAALTRFLPEQLANLRAALAAKPVSLATLPKALTVDWLLPDGRARIQVLPTAAADTSAGLHAFVREVQAVAPDAGGAAVTIVATSATIVNAFRTAAIAALIAIAAILAIALRRALDVGLVLAPLLLSALMTVIAVVALPLPLNFANIIALPLLLGVGVSFNVYFVMNWRAGRRAFLGSPTARAVLFSALTTATAFGTLALSAHPGTASLGLLLVISLACTLVGSLLFLPALLYAMPAPPENGSGT